jgi:hypothetical protein
MVCNFYLGGNHNSADNPTNIEDREKNKNRLAILKVLETF